MRYFWIVLALLAILILHIIVAFGNMYNMVYNLFHKKKKAISWNPMQGMDERGMDETERFYHN